MSPSDPTDAFGARFLRALRAHAGGTPFNYATAKRIKGLDRSALIEQLRALAVADFGTLKRLAEFDDPEALARELALAWRNLQAEWTRAHSARPSQKTKRQRAQREESKPTGDTFGSKFVRALRKEWGGAPLDYVVLQEFKQLEQAELAEALVEHACVDRVSLAVARSCSDPEQLALKVAEAWRSRGNEGILAGPVRLAPDAWSASTSPVEEASAASAAGGPFGTRFLNALRHHWSEATFDYATTKRIKAMNREDVLAALAANGKLDKQTLDAAEYFQSPEQLARLVATARRAARENSVGATALEALFGLGNVF